MGGSGVVGGFGGGGGLHEVSVVFAGEAVAFGVQDEDGVYFGQEGGLGGAEEGHGGEEWVSCGAFRSVCETVAWVGSGSFSSTRRSTS